MRLIFSLLLFKMFLLLTPVVGVCQDFLSNEKLYAEYDLDYYPAFIKWTLNDKKQDKINDSGEFSYVLNKIIRSCTNNKYNAYIFSGIGKHLTGIMPKEMADNPWIEITITSQGVIGNVRVENKQNDDGFNYCLENTLKNSRLNPGLINGSPVNCVLIYILKG